MILYSISKLIHIKYFYFWCFLIFYIQNNSSLLVCATNVIVIIIKEPFGMWDSVIYFNRMVTLN